jgi:hypothetical protein
VKASKDFAAQYGITKKLNSFQVSTGRSFYGRQSDQLLSNQPFHFRQVASALPINGTEPRSLKACTHDRRFGASQIETSVILAVQQHLPTSPIDLTNIHNLLPTMEKISNKNILALDLKAQRSPRGCGGELEKGTIMNNLASVLTDQGKHDEAEAMAG